MENKNHRRLCFILVAVAFLWGFIVPTQVQSAYFAWIDWEAGSHSWSDCANWGASRYQPYIDTCPALPGTTGEDYVELWHPWNYPGYSVTVESSATVDIHALGMDWILDYNSPSMITLKWTGGSLTARQEYIGQEGGATFNHISATNTTDWLYVGYSHDEGNFPSDGYYNLGAPGVLTVNFDEVISYHGVGTFTQTGGTHAVGRDLYLGMYYHEFQSGFGTSNGTFNMSGGSLDVGQLEYIGHYGPGVFNQTGGTHTVAGSVYVGTYDGSIGNSYSLSNGTHEIGEELYVGYESGAEGTYNLGPDGILTVHGNEYIGSYGDAQFIQTGGTHTVINDLWCDPYGAQTTNTVTFNLVGGSLTVVNFYLGQDCEFNLDELSPPHSGNLIVLGDSSLYIGGIFNWKAGGLTAPTIINVGTFNVSGASGTERHVDYLILAPNSILNVSPGVTLYYNVLEDYGGTIIGSVLPAQGANNPPIADPNGHYSGDEGSPVQFDGTGSNDPDGDILTYDWDFGDGNTGIGPTPSHTYIDNGNNEVCLTVTDTGGLTDTECTVADIANVAPSVGTISAPIDPVQEGTTIQVSADFTDPGTEDSHSAVWYWGDGTSDEGVVTQGAGAGSVEGTYAYQTAGVYMITLTVTDKDGGVGESIYEFVVVYNPDGGFVTGGGWIYSPEGAYVADPTLTGKASFGFVSKYKKGATAPTGNTEFQFHAGDFNFHSSSYDWLVIAGHKAKYKGVGTVDGSGNYGFMLSAIDEKLTPSTDVDLFRIKIWDKDNGDVTVYDNEMGAANDADPATVLGGGSIVIHKAKK
jgi:PKD repeat protein